MKGLIFEIYRSDYDSKLNVMHGKKSVTVIDVAIDEIFDAQENRPAVRIVRRNLWGKEYVHAEPVQRGPYMFGGTYIATSDSRSKNISQYPIPLHDRVEKPGQDYGGN